MNIEFNTNRKARNRWTFLGYSFSYKQNSSYIKRNIPLSWLNLCFSFKKFLEMDNMEPWNLEFFLTHIRINEFIWNGYFALFDGN